MDIDPRDLESLLDTLEPQLASLLFNFTSLMTAADGRAPTYSSLCYTDSQIHAAHHENLTLLVETLRNELNVTASALMEALQILEFISGRNFSADAMDLQRYQELTSAATLLAMRLWDAIVAISRQARVVLCMANMRL